MRSFIRLSHPLILAIALCALPAPASAYYSGGDLLTDCQAGLASGRANFCLGFLAAAIQSIQHLENIDLTTQTSTCDPNEIDTELVVRLFVSWARAHRERLVGPAIISLRLALIESALSGVGVAPCKPPAR
jgi:Rap1a immunity proteins